MQTHTIPYILNDKKNWNGFGLLNDNPDEHIVMVRIYRFSDGEELKELAITVTPFSGASVNPDSFPLEEDNDRFYAKISGPDNLSVIHSYRSGYYLYKVDHD